MRRILLAILISALSLVPVTLATANVYAVDVLSPVCTNPDLYGKTPAVCKGDDSASGTANPVYTILKVVIDILSAVVGIASVIIIIVQGIRMVLSGGDANTIAGARNGIIYAVVGILVALLAQAFVAFVLKRFTT